MLRRYGIVGGFAVMLAMVGVFAFAGSAFAASLYFSPASENVAVGQNFTVAVEVSSPDQAMNAASGDISFPSNKLRVLSVSNTASAMNLWVQNPSFSNSVSGGDINFAGVALNPGFIGTGGNVITIRLQAVAVGSAQLSFSTGSVLANDGNGTNILDSMGVSNITIVPAAAATVPAPAPATPSVLAPVTASPPLPFVISEETTDPTDPQPLFTWVTNAPSGIAKYLVKIGGGDWFDASMIGVSSTPDVYQLPLQAPEENVVLTVDAYDGLGDMTEATTMFSIAPLPAPSITSYTSNVGSANPIFQARGIVPKGSAGRATTVRLYLQQAGYVMSYSVPVDANGNWSVNQIVNLPAGNWVLYAQASDSRGALSSNTPAVAVIIGGWVTDIIVFLLSWGAILATFLVLLGAIVAVAYLLIHHMHRFHISLSRQLVRERKEMRDDLLRIEKELDIEKSSSKIDLSAAGLRKKQLQVRREIEHLEEDLKRDIAGSE